MPSGKKARGRQNRAKKEATLAAAQRLLWEPAILRNNDVASNIATCEHTLATLPRIPQGGPAVSFMNCLAGEGFFDSAASFAGTELCFESLSRFPEVWKVESERSLAMDLLLRFVRSTFLQDSAIEGEKWFHSREQNEVSICRMINALELRGTYSDLTVARRRAARINNKLAGGNRRDVVKFVAKRLPCTCLKELHHAARKKVAKMGTCFHCREQFPRSQLYICTGCICIDYCSSECQRAHWSDHKEDCGYPEVMSRFLHSDYYVFKRS